MATREQVRATRKKRVRKKIEGSTERPRLSVYRSAKHTYAQVVNDLDGKTLAAASTVQKDLKGTEGNKTEAAKAVGIALAKVCKDKGISTVVFDRNGFIYHGRVKAVAEGAREGGLSF